MKNILLLFMFPIFVFGQYTSIPDSMFEQRLIDLGYDTINDGQVLTADIVNIDTLILENPYNGSFPGSSSFTYGPISDLTGIEDFSNLTYLDCSGGNIIDTLDLSQNLTLTYLNCSGAGWVIQHFRQISSLNISQNTALSHLICNSTLLSQLDLSQNPNLTFLNCRDNEPQILDLSHNIGLLNLDCSHSILNQNLWNSGNPVTHLTNLDLSQNINLTSLNCSGNALSSLDLSQNINLTSLNCSDNQLQILDLSQNIGLVNLDCGNDIWGDFDNTNQLTNLDLSQNINLTSINCYGNSLSNLDLRNGNNTNIGFFNSGNNDSLYCISVDDSSWATANLTIPNQTIFSNNCNNLQYTLIPDSIFEQRLIDLGYDNIHNGQVLTANISSIDTLILIPPIGGFFVAIPYNTISDFTGIEDFINLTYFDCRYNSITTLDLSNNTLLSFLDCSGFHNGNTSMGQLTNLNINQNIFLDSLKCSGNQLDSLNVSQNINLKSLIFGKTIFNPMGNDYSGNNISNIDLSQNINLTNLECSDNLLTNLDLSNNTFLSYLDCRKNQISNINITNCNGLTSFNCSNNLLINLNVSQNINLGDMNCSNNLLANLNLSQNIFLGDLDCSNNNIDTLDMTQNPNLFKLSCHNNILTELNINQNILLGDLNCNNNFLDTLDITQNPNLGFLRCENNLMSYLDLTSNTSLSDLRCSNNQLNILNTNNLSFLSRLFCSDNQLVSLDIRNTSLDSGPFGSSKLRATNNPDLFCISVDDSIWASNNWSSNWTSSWPPSIDSHTIFSNNCNNLQYTLIPDSIFEQRLIDLGYDNIHDGQVLTANISSIDSLDISGIYLEEIEDLTGIQDFTNLLYLDCSLNLLPNLDLSQNTSLTYLNCHTSGISNLDLSQNTALTKIICYMNPQLTGLDLSQNTSLTYLNCLGNFVTFIFGQISDLNLSQNIALDTLLCSGNQLTSLDVSQNVALKYLDCGYNKLTSLDVRNGNNINFTGFDATQNDSLICISVDDSTWSDNNWQNIDSHTSFSNDCNPSTVNIIEIEKNLSVYPNPTNEEITISINNFNGNIQTEVYDFIGNRLHTTNKTTISLRDYSLGIYLLKVTYGDRVQEVKVIKD